MIVQSVFEFGIRHKIQKNNFILIEICKKQIKFLKNLNKSKQKHTVFSQNPTLWILETQLETSCALKQKN